MIAAVCIDVIACLGLHNCASQVASAAAEVYTAARFWSLLGARGRAQLIALYAVAERIMNSLDHSKFVDLLAPSRSP